MKTIKEIADEIGVSKQAIRKEIDNLNLQTDLQRNGNKILLNENQENLIKKAFKRRRKQTQSTNQFTNQTETENTKLALEILREQLKEKDKIIARLQDSLDKAQDNLKNITSAINNRTEELKYVATSGTDQEQPEIIEVVPEETIKQPEDIKKPWYKRLFG